MFSELPKLFERNFVIAYFLPVSLFLAASTWLIKAVGYWKYMGSWLSGNAVYDATAGIFLAWLVSILLLVLNREIYRVLEGYGRLNPLQLRARKAREIFANKRDRKEKIRKAYWKKKTTDQDRLEHDKLVEELALKYPDEERHVLPTAFGNVIRAFEVYPRVMYGMEAIDGWSRILAVVPEEYRRLIDDAKAQVDWWINLVVMSVLFLLEFWAFIFIKWGISPGLIRTALNIAIPLAICILMDWIFLWRATSAAMGWGDFVKSAFDLYRFDLLESLGIDAPKTRASEKTLWTNFSRAIYLRMSELLPPLKKSGSKSASRKKTKEK